MIAGVGVQDGHGAWVVRSRLRCRWRQYGSGVAGIVVLNELPDLLFERHLAEQAIDAGLECRIGKLRV
jgi:hypothetical protein